MTEKETKAKAPKKEAAPKAEAKQPAKAPAKKAEAKSAAKPASGGSLRVTQLVGTIGRQSYQRATLIGLGLNKRHRSKVLADTPEIRGMIEAVKHLVKVEKA